MFGVHISHRLYIYHEARALFKYASFQTKKKQYYNQAMLWVENYVEASKPEKNWTYVHVWVFLANT